MSNFGLKIEKSNEITNWKDFKKGLCHLIHHHGFVLFRGFDISDEEFTELSVSLGKPVKYAFGNILKMQPRENSDESQFTNHRMAIHQDTILNESEKGIFLSFKCKIAPKINNGGETILTNNRQFLKIIPKELLCYLRKSFISYKSNSANYYEGEANQRKSIIQSPFISHPKFKEEVLFIGINDPSDPKRNYESKFVGMSDEESDRLMQEIDGYLRYPSVKYEHQWQEGDVLILDNFLTCHGRNSFNKNQDRKLIRIVLS